MIFIIGTFLILALIGFAVFGLSVLWFTVIVAAALGLVVVWLTMTAAFAFVPLVPPEIWGSLAALTVFVALIASTFRNGRQLVLRRGLHELDVPPQVHHKDRAADDGRDALHELAPGRLVSLHEPSGRDKSALLFRASIKPLEERPDVAVDDALGALHAFQLAVERSPSHALGFGDVVADGTR
jgi:hypothetical protein